MRVSIIVPTLNEEAGIAAFLAALVPLGAHEVIVSDGGSADQTREIAAAHGARVVTAPPGRGPQMNRGAAIAQGDVFLFLHADVRLQATALLAIEAALANPRHEGGIFDVHFDGDDWVAHSFYWIYHWRRYLGIFYGDAGIFVRREAFARLGGFRNYPIMEDYEFGRRLFGWGGRMAFLAEPIRVSDRRWRQAGLARTLWAWVVIQTLYSLGISPERLGPIYRQIR
jgi:rSAM/selenodomain-associated transferase 2